VIPGAGCVTGCLALPHAPQLAAPGDAEILAVVKPPRILLFDVFGTLVDWRSSLIDIAEATATRSKVQADWAGIVDD
jgi:hypothetical protein